MLTDLTDQIHQYLTTAPSSLFAQQEVAMLDHWEGDAHLLWRVAVGEQQAVVKLFLDAGQARSRRQFDGHRVFAPLSLAPQPLWADRYPHGLSHQLMVYRWSDGEPIDPSAPDALLAWAEAIATLHAAPTNEVQRFSPHPLNLDFYWRIEQGSIARINEWLTSSNLAMRELFTEIATATERLVQSTLPYWVSVPPAPIHGDLTREHTLIERGRVILLDWEMFGLGDPALDVARLLQHEAQTLTPDQIQQWCDHYLQIIDEPTFATRIDTFQRLLQVHNVIYLLVGLQQNTSETITSELSDALPFIQVALATATEGAAAALGVTLPHECNATAAEFVAWLVAGTPVQISSARHQNMTPNSTSTHP